MRKLVVAGILESDAVYRECLETLRHYMRLLKASSTTSQPAMVMTDHDVIFYKIEELYEINVEFYGKLKYRLDNWTEDMQVGDLFLESTKSFPVYGDYVNNYQKAMETVEKCRRENENFENVAQRIPKPSSKENLVTLEGLLYRPLQRVTKMTLTLHDLMKHTPTDSPDYKILQKALTCSEEFLSQVNERAKLKGKLKKEHKKSPSTSKESQKKRKLIKEGHIVEQVDRTNRKLRQIFLYTDVIICAKQKTTSSLLSGPKEQYDCKWYIPVSDLLLNPQDDQCPATPVPVPGEESLETLRARIAETKMQIRSVQGEGNKKPNKGAQKNIDKNRKKLAEMEGQMLLISPNLPLRLANKDGKSYTLLMSSDYERSEWRESIEKAIQNIKAKPSNSTPVSAYEIQSLTARQKVKTLHQNVTSMIIKDDEELMSGILKVNVHSATNFEREGNYYCCLEVDSYGHFYLIAKTNCSPATKQAEWNQEFELDIDGAQTLRILCYRQEDSTNGDTLVGKGAHEMPKLNQKDTRVAVKLDSIEVTVSMNYDSHGRQTMKRFKSKRSGGVFGVKIGKVTKREGTNIPNIITTCCSEIERRGLSELGIYRISGVTSDIQKLKKAFENNARNVDTLVAESDIHAIACVVKLYFRELPEPLFTNELYNNFVNGFGLSDVHAKQNCMVSLLENLPEPNQSTVIYLLEHLRRVANNEIENKMTLHNLATVFGPNLLRPSVNVDEENASSQSFMLLEATCFTNVMAQVGVFLYYLEGKAELPTSESHDL
ncbi:active breakpoint cluster region-related protein-like isoform X3 [Ptychodera flava]